MAQEDKGSGGNLPVAGILALVLFASGLWVQHQPLQTDRPGVELKQEKEAAVHQDVEARLWQDPLEAVKRAETEAGKAAKPSADAQQRHKAESFRKWIGDSKGKQRLVLPVMVFGGSYAEDAEQRRRTRYAVLSGLREGGYEPDNSRSIGYVKLPTYKALVPFEKWQRISMNRSSWEEVYVLWVAEESLGEQPVKRLSEVLDRLVPKDDASITVTVLGPASDRMAVDLAGRLAQHPQALQRTGSGMVQASVGKRRIGFIAPNFSIPAYTLARRLARRDTPPQEQDAEENRLTGLLQEPLQQLRVGPDDARLAKLLLGELRNRGIAVSADETHACNDQVALVAEADTHYARSLAHEFTRLLKPCKSRFAPMVFHYFRGLDGKVAQGDTEEKKSDDAPRDKSKQDATPYQERAQGQGQFDYLRRIGDEIKRRSDAQHREVQNAADSARDAAANNTPSSPDLTTLTSRGAVRAVIVVGSDMHDKLAVLHALRESLPDALFVTTDLDAGLLQKEQLSWTRNALVGSGFDLMLPPALQKAAPPFRDTYQTASFLATRKALLANDTTLADKHDERRAAQRRQIDEQSRLVHLFEIGNKGAVPLSVDAADAYKPTSKRLGENSGLGHYWEIAGAALVTMFVLGLALNWRLRQFLIDLRRGKDYAVRCTVVGAASLVYFIALLFCIGKVSALPGQEPLRWFAGVSVWPTALICNAAGVLALVFFMVGWYRLRQGEKAIDDEFFKDENAPAQQAQEQGSTQSRGAKAPWFHEFQESWLPASDAAQAQERSHVLAVWQQYKAWGSWQSTLPRVTLGVVAVLVMVGVMLYDLSLPTSPVRGPTSTVLMLFMVVSAYLMTVPLLVWTLDRVALCSLFLHRLYGSDDAPRRSGWSDATRTRFCGSKRLAGDDAEAVESYIDLRLSARISRHVGGIIVFPFVVILMFIVARARYFDNWGVTLGYLVIVLVILALLALAAFSLRQNAERIRRYTIEQFETLELRMRAPDYQPTTPATRDQLAMMKEIAVNLREGAFAPFTSQPIVRAILLPFGGAGLINLLDFVLI